MVSAGGRNHSDTIVPGTHASTSERSDPMWHKTRVPTPKLVENGGEGGGVCGVRSNRWGDLPSHDNFYCTISNFDVRGPKTVDPPQTLVADVDRLDLSPYLRSGRVWVEVDRVPKASPCEGNSDFSDLLSIGFQFKLFIDL